MHIEATDVTKSYGPVTALDGLSLSIPSGSTYGLLGTNGAGKTTLFRLLIGHDRPDEGTVRVGDETVSAAGPRLRQRVGYLPERVGFPPELTAREVLRVTARVRGLSDAGERVDAALATVGLADDADRPVEGFSNGMRRRLGLATALLPDPDVLLLDEPTAGLDPLGVVDFHRIVEDVSERTGATVLVCSHALAEVERLCDRAAVLSDGRLLADGELDELTEGHADLEAAFEAIVGREGERSEPSGGASGSERSERHASSDGSTQVDADRSGTPGEPAAAQSGGSP